MSRMYSIPPDMKEKEKVIGGILNINQAGWLGGGLASGAVIFAITFGIVGGTLALLLGFIFCFSGLPFAFYSKNGLTLFQYITYKRKFNKKVKKLPNKRKEVKF